jgi:hypothetical protein
MENLGAAIMFRFVIATMAIVTTCLADLFVFRPVRYESPAHDDDLALACLKIQTHHWLKAMGSGVIAGDKIRDMLSFYAKCFSDFLLVRAPAISSAHNKMLSVKMHRDLLTGGAG